MNGTDESSSSWMRAHPASSPLGDGAPSSGLSKTERGFALCMFTEKITFNSQPSSRTSILVGRNTCRRRACRTGSPSPSISLTFALAGTLGKPFRKHLVLPPFKLFILNWDLACCHYYINIKVWCTVPVFEDLGKNICLKLRTQEKLCFAWKPCELLLSNFVDALTEPASRFPLAGGQPLLFSR